MTVKPPAYLIESVDRALQVITMLQSGERIGVSQVADRLGVAPSTAHRILNALCHRSFAVQDSDRGYRAGPALGQSQAPVSRAVFSRASRPALAALSELLNETAHLLVLQGAFVRFIDGVESEQPLRVAMRLGAHMPAHCSAGGKALLAELAPPDVDRLYRGGMPRWATAKVGSVPELKRQLLATRRRGYGLNVEETEPGVCGLGVCVRDIEGRPVGAITVAVPSTRFKDRRRFADAVRDAALTAGNGLAARAGEPQGGHD